MARLVITISNASLDTEKNEKVDIAVFSKAFASIKKLVAGGAKSGENVA